MDEQQNQKMTEADYNAQREAKRPERELKLLHALKSAAVENENLRRRLDIARHALAGFGLKLIDEAE